MRAKTADLHDSCAMSGGLGLSGRRSADGSGVRPRSKLWERPDPAARFVPSAILRCR